MPNPNRSIAELRQEYGNRALEAERLADDPIEQFSEWFNEALQADVPEPNAMTLATVTTTGQPTTRVVLMKGFDAAGFVFYSNYDSAKASDLAANPRAALNFFWVAIHRQVKILGTTSKVSAAESDEYFASRPRGSQLGAWASTQSAPIAERRILEARLAELEAHFAEQTVPRPAHWGGYRVEPQCIEFWQGRANRLHDRFEYRRTPEGVWRVQRLAP